MQNSQFVHYCIYISYITLFIFQDFVNAANCYEQLTLLYPDNEDYKIYYAQALYQACLYEEAMKVTVQIENPELQGKVRIMKIKQPFLKIVFVDNIISDAEITSSYKIWR